MFKVTTATLERVCGITSKIPAHTLAEYAFCGRSNVGKSSLINGLMNRKALARTSSAPGKTATINFYNVNNAFYLVDLPGYGYTKVNLATKAKWGKMVDSYFEKSTSLKMIFLLVDIRHPPTSDDSAMYNWLKESGKEIAIIATKADKIKKSQVGISQKTIRNTLGLASETPVIAYSSKTKAGREMIYQIIQKGEPDGNNQPKESHSPLH